jgi:hypothetical protein
MGTWQPWRNLVRVPALFFLALLTSSLWGQSDPGVGTHGSGFLSDDVIDSVRICRRRQPPRPPALPNAMMPMAKAGVIEQNEATSAATAVALPPAS